MFKPRPYDPDRPDKRSPAQKASHQRSYQIFRLRGLWAQAGLLSAQARHGVRALIDFDLFGLGAEPEGVRQVRIKNENYQKLKAERDPREDEIPY
jgi:hypothetical protein